MIISASRRTDIPAFFGTWFMNRIEEGYFYRVNPFNPNQIKKISLEPQDIDLFVFWTKNPKPFMRHLQSLDEKGYHYYFQFTLNDYPKLFEPNLPPIKERVQTFQNLSRRIGKEKVLWRYDPIIISNITPAEYHLIKIEKLAEKLTGYTNRLTISFLDFYRKVNKRLKKLETNDNISFSDITENIYQEKIIDLSKGLFRITQKYGIEIVTCAEQINLDDFGIRHGSCIDGQLMKDLFKLNNDYVKDKNQRSECLCVEAVDMGMYNTCSFMCSYCYANISEKTVENNQRKHILSSPFLIGDIRNDN